MLLTQFSNLRNNNLHVYLDKRKDVSISSEHIFKLCFDEITKKKALNEDLFFKIMQKDILKILFLSIIKFETNHDIIVSKFTSMIYFLELIAQQKQDKNFRITCVKFTTKNSVELCFSDCFNIVASSTGSNSEHASFFINAELFKKHHDISNSLIVNLNQQKEVLNNLRDCHIGHVSFTKSFYDTVSFFNTEQIYLTKLSFDYFLSHDIFRNIQNPPFEIFDNFKSTSDFHPLSFEHLNCFLRFYKSMHDKHKDMVFVNLMTIEINFLKNVLYSIPFYNDIALLNNRDWHYILNMWINHIIYPGYTEGINFLVTQKNDNYIISIMKKKKCLRHIWLRGNRFKDDSMWFFLSDDFNHIFYQRQMNVSDFLDQDLLNDFHSIYQSKKPHCLLHPTVELEKVCRRKLFTSYRGIFFLDNYGESSSERNQFMKDLSLFENIFKNCKKCTTHFSSHDWMLITNDSRKLQNLYLSSLFLYQPISIIKQSRKQTEQVTAAASSSEIFTDPDEPTVVNITFIVYNDLPSKGGTATVEYVNFPKLNFVYDKITYEISFDLKYLPPTKQDEYKYIKFGIWGKKNNFCTLIHSQHMNPEKKLQFKFKYDSHDFLEDFSEIYYGEIENYNNWGICQMVPFGSVNLIEDIKYIPNCVIFFNQKAKLDRKMKTCVTQLQLSDLPHTSTSLPIHDNILYTEQEILHEKFKIQSIWFILQNGIDLPSEIIQDQKQRNAMFFDPYKPFEEKNYFIKFAITDGFKLPKLSNDPYENILNTSEIELPKNDKYFINFVFHPSITDKDISENIPKLLTWQTKRGDSFIHIKDMIASQFNGFFGHEQTEIIILSVSNTYMRKELMKITFN